MGYQVMSIKDAINKISMKQMYLPEIQRNFVWKEKQIEDLFDSIIMGYPIGTFLLWKTTTKNINDTKPIFTTSLVIFMKETANTTVKKPPRF
jgi:uncharacterized protein with ParB-like and HNH nuclease domain